MRASAFFSIQKKNGAVSYARGDDFISPLVIRSQPPLAEEPEKKLIGPTINESMPLYLHLPRTGGTTGRMECFNGNAAVTWVVEAGSRVKLFLWESSAVNLPFSEVLMWLWLS